METQLLYKPLIKLTGSVNAAMILSYIINQYREFPEDVVKRDGEYWVIVPRHSWDDELCYTPDQADTILKKLETGGFIVREIHKSNGVPKTHVHPVWERIPEFREWRDGYRQTARSLSIYNRDESLSLPHTENTSVSSSKKEKKSAKTPFLRPPDRPVNRRASFHERTETKGRVETGEMPPIAHAVIRFLKEHGVNATSLSQAQIENLTTVKVVAPGYGTFDAPAMECERFPEQWKRFWSHLSDMAFFEKAIGEQRVRLTAGNLIKMIRGYHWAGGWLEYRPDENQKYTETHKKHNGRATWEMMANPLPGEIVAIHKASRPND
jgi:hypothetical protein